MESYGQSPTVQQRAILEPFILFYLNSPTFQLNWPGPLQRGFCFVSHTKMAASMPAKLIPKNPPLEVETVAPEDGFVVVVLEGG